jgi:hypothetical protein
MAKRGPTLAKKWYPDTDDQKGRNGTEYSLWSRIEIQFTNGSTVGCDLSELPKDIIQQAACHGLNQKIGDSYAGAEGDINKAVDWAEAVLDELKLGNWSKDREVGPRLKDLYEAIRRVARDAGLGDVTDEQLDAKYKTHENAKTNRDNAKATPQVKAKLAEIEAEKAMERERAAKAAIGDTTVTTAAAQALI